MSKFLHNWMRTDTAVFLEVIIPGGNIIGVFRNLRDRLLVLEGNFDRVEWSISENKPSDSEVLKLLIPEDYNLQQMGVSLDPDRDRILFKLPIIAS